MNYKTISQEDIEDFKALLGDAFVSIDTETLTIHSKDQTKNLASMPEVVLKPADTEGVSRILKLCHERHIPVTVQGGQSGLSGGAVPMCGGVALSLSRLDKIIQIDKDNFQVVVEPAVITEQLQNEVQKQGLFYPPDPAGRGWSFIGGNIATNAGGPKCVKYGVTRDYVLNLEVVLPNGEIIWTGANTLKFSSGYNLTHLFIGSEGTLGVVTKIVLKLLSYPSFNLLLLVPFFKAEQACEAANRIFQAGIVPSSLEFMDKTTLEYAMRYVGESPVPIKPEHEVHLLIELDGHNLELLHQDCEKIAEVIMPSEPDEILFADSESVKNDLWKLRRNAGAALLQLNKAKISEDTVVPRATLPHFISEIKKIAQKYQLQLANLGHLGDGNLHINFVNPLEPSDPQIDDDAWLKKAYQAKKEVFQLVKSLNGALSAEHGVGFIQKEYMPIFFNNTHLSLLRGIKHVFDPHNILNPKKILPEE